MSIQRTLGGVVTCLVLLVSAGCQSDGLSEVSGTVKVDGTPIAEGQIRFEPIDGKTQVTGGKITNGQYSVRVPQGKMKVSISMPKVAGKKKLYDTPDSPMREIFAEALPEEYNDKTKLELDVNGRTVEKDWDLSGK